MVWRVVLRIVGFITFPLLSGLLFAGHIGTRLPANDELAYVSRIHGDFEIFLLDVPRNINVNLTKTAYWSKKRFLSQDQAPSWSPDGSKIAFHSNRAGNDDIYVMDANGRNVHRITTHRAMDLHPQWSPDSLSLVYQSFRETDYEIFTIRIEDALNGLAPTQLTDNQHSDRHPYFSPDGTRLVFASDMDNIFDNFQLFTMNPDGTERRLLFTLGEEVNSLHPRWSPDGEYIIFDSFSNEARNNIYNVRANGRGRTQRVVGEPGRQNGTDAFLPSWSPDGQNILFVSNNGTENIEVYMAPFIAPFETDTPRQLTFNISMDIQPVMRPRR